ncbi:hypothetical protein M9Y10_027490 [Tritrichomonas musculus]|uniref:Uncharacterized protein n=1 Tax=Tritrichomonas musculus TaxID=1915356 RepID=A0ABR2H6C6_9EUKA
MIPVIHYKSLFLTPDIYLKIYLENQKTPHRWKHVAKRIDIPGIDNIIVKNEDYRKHQHSIKKISFNFMDIIEYNKSLNEEFEDEIDEDAELEEEDGEEEEFEEEEENTTDDESMNPY